jgi:hypothetical protein
VLAFDRETLSTRHEHTHISTSAQHRFGEARGGVQDVFAVVEHQQTVIGPEHLRDATSERHAGTLLDTEGLGDDDLHCVD